MDISHLPQHYQDLVTNAQQHISDDDPSHDRGHISRVFYNCLLLQKTEGGDLDIIIPAALFHDVVNYAKTDTRASLATDESAEFAGKLLSELDWYPKEKIPAVEYCIKHCSFTKNLPHETLESKVLQDADFLESVGAISLMRTFSSGGKMNRPLFHPTEPFPTTRATDPHRYSFDLIRHRLVKVEERMLTKTGKKLAKQRTEFLRLFVEQVRKEMDGK